MKTYLYYLTVITVLLIMFSCKKEPLEEENINNNQSVTDFRDDYIGLYNCTKIYHYVQLDSSGNWYWLDDTIFTNSAGSIAAELDSSLKITIGSDSYIGNYSDSEGYFGIGGKGYIQFDSSKTRFSIFYQTSPLNSYKFYGTK